MQRWLDKLIDLTAIHGDESILKQALADLTDEAGFGSYSYLYFRPGHTLSISNHHPEWRSIYLKRRLEAVDPVVKRARTLRQAFIWSAETERTRLSRSEQAFFVKAAEYGIRSGITVPVRAANGSMSMFTLASEKPAIECKVDPVAAAAAVGQLHTRISFLPVTPSEQYPAWLDPRESAYLNWIAVGKTMQEVADLEGVKYNSVKSKLYETRKRLNIHTMSHLIALAIRAGLI